MKKNPLSESSHRPINDKLIEFQFPSFQKKVLENGFTLLVLENRKVPKVYYRLGFDLGDKNDPATKEGAVELLAHVLKKGTASLSYHEIAEQIDFMGGHLEVDYSRDFFYLSGDFLKEYSDVGLKLMSDVVLNPAFHKEEIEKERKKIIADIQNEKSSPAFLAQRRFKRVIFFPHPYSETKSPESIAKISRGTLIDLYGKFFIPSNMFMVVTGDISFNKVSDQINRYFGKWYKNEKNSVADFQLPEIMNKRKVFLVDRPNSEQSNVLLGSLLFNRKNTEFERFQVMNKILGGGSSGRLFMKLREEKGFTYGAYSMMSCFKEAGAWQASAEVRTEVTTEALDTFFEQFQEIQNEPVSDEELKNAKRYLIGSFPIKNETSAAMASLELQKKLYKLPEDYWNSYLKKIDKVSKSDVNEMAKGYLNLEKIAIVVVGDAKKLGKSLQKFGEIELYDLDDKRIN